MRSSQVAQGQTLSERGALKIEPEHSEASRHSADRQPLLRRTRCSAKSRQPRMRPTRALKERLIRSKHDAGDPASKTAEETRCYNVPFRYSIRRSRLMTGGECTSGRRCARSFASSSARRCGSADGWAGWPQPAVLFHRTRSSFIDKGPLSGLTIAGQDLSRAADAAPEGVVER